MSIKRYVNEITNCFECSEFLPTSEKWNSYFVIFSATIERPDLKRLPDGNKEAPNSLPMVISRPKRRREPVGGQDHCRGLQWSASAGYREAKVVAEGQKEAKAVAEGHKQSIIVI
jgi:hypothetical protein